MDYEKILQENEGLRKKNQELQKRLLELEAYKQSLIFTISNEDFSIPLYDRGFSDIEVDFVLDEAHRNFSIWDAGDYVDDFTFEVLENREKSKSAK